MHLNYITFPSLENLILPKQGLCYSQLHFMFLPPKKEKKDKDKKIRRYKPLGHEFESCGNFLGSPP